jgi:hypothetical protein
MGVYLPPAFEGLLGGEDTNSPLKCEWKWVSLLWLCANSIMEDSFFFAGKSVYGEAEHMHNLLADYMPVLLRAYHSGHGINTSGGARPAPLQTDPACPVVYPPLQREYRQAGKQHPGPDLKRGAVGCVVACG